MNIFGRAGDDFLDGASFGREIERLLWHLGFTAVTNVDGAGDMGADIIGDRDGVRWVIQCKHRVRGAVGAEAVEEVIRGYYSYGASRAAVVSNVGFTKDAQATVERYKALSGIEVQLWSGDELNGLWCDAECSERFGRATLRPYQANAFVVLKHDLTAHGRALLILATGLGKTVVAGTCVDWFLSANPGGRVLVVVHAKELVQQLERAMWRHITKYCPTQQLTGDSHPRHLIGVTCATIQSAVKYVREGYRPGLIVIDEAHHLGADSQYAELLTTCMDAKVLGVTATPWRGDKFDVESILGQASFKLGIEEGLRLGFLCDVDYRVYADNIDWNFVRRLSDQNYSIADLNTKLFLPQRDERIRDQLLDAWHKVAEPRAIVFCQSVQHAERVHAGLVRISMWSGARLIHAGLSKRDRQVNLMDFRSGRAPILVAVDVLNEGVDVPDVNIICFARVTHSRRIFVQQLGRGLRISSGKTKVVVLDFISDLRRVACVLNLRKQLASECDELYLPSSHRIEFSDLRAETLMVEWIKDAADLETANDQARLNFPGGND